MKEFFLIPSSEMKSHTPVQVTTSEANLPGRTETAKEIIREVKKDKVLENEINLPPEVVLKLYDRLKRGSHSSVEEEPVTTDQVKNRAVSENKKQDDARDMETLINTLPTNLRTLGRGLSNYLTSKDLIKVDENGMVKMEGVDGTFRIEDILRSIIVKNASVNKVKSIIDGLLPNLPLDIIRNDKVRTLKTIGSGEKRSIIIKNKSLSKWLRW